MILQDVYKITVIKDGEDHTIYKGTDIIKVESEIIKLLKNKIDFLVEVF